MEMLDRLLNIFLAIIFVCFFAIIISIPLVAIKDYYKYDQDCLEITATKYCNSIGKEYSFISGISKIFRCEDIRQAGGQEYKFTPNELKECESNVIFIDAILG